MSSVPAVPGVDFINRLNRETLMQELAVPSFSEEQILDLAEKQLVQERDLARAPNKNCLQILTGDPEFSYDRPGPFSVEVSELSTWLPSVHGRTLTIKQGNRVYTVNVRFNLLWQSSEWATMFATGHVDFQKAQARLDAFREMRKKVHT